MCRWFPRWWFGLAGIWVEALVSEHLQSINPSHRAEGYRECAVARTARMFQGLVPRSFQAEKRRVFLGCVAWKRRMLGLMGKNGGVTSRSWPSLRFELAKKDRRGIDLCELPAFFAFCVLLMPNACQMLTEIEP